jgi:hypothetical protein
MAASSTGKGPTRATAKEKSVMVVIALFGAVFVTMVGASDKWLAAVFITVVTFGAVISYCRDRWQSKAFWNVLAGVFLIHLALLYLIFAIALKRRSDVGLLVCVPIILVESSLVYYAVMFLERLFYGSDARATK